MAEAMVLCVLCMNTVGLSCSSRLLTMSSRKMVLSSSIPFEVAAMIASGRAIPASRRAVKADSRLAFITLLMRRVSMGGRNSRNPLSSSSLETMLRAAMLMRDSSFRGRSSVPGRALLRIREESFPPKPKELHMT